MFWAETENGATLQLIQWLKMAVVPGWKQVGKFAQGLAAKFNEVINGVRYGINSGRLESVNAGIQRIRSKCCGLFDIDNLLVKMRQITFQGGHPAINRFETASRNAPPVEKGLNMAGKSARLGA